MYTRNTMKIYEKRGMAESHTGTQNLPLKGRLWVLCMPAARREHTPPGRTADALWGSDGVETAARGLAALRRNLLALRKRAQVGQRAYGDIASHP